MNKLIITNATNTAMNAYRECKAFIYNAKELLECNNPASFSRLFKLACLNPKDFEVLPMNKFSKIPNSFSINKVNLFFTLLLLLLATNVFAVDFAKTEKRFLGEWKFISARTVNVGSYLSLVLEENGKCRYHAPIYLYTALSEKLSDLEITHLANAEAFDGGDSDFLCDSWDVFTENSIFIKGNGRNFEGILTPKGLSISGYPSGPKTVTYTRVRTLDEYKKENEKAMRERMSDAETNKKTNKKVFKDPRDGNAYSYVTIGSQTWMAEDLKYIPESCGKPVIPGKKNFVGKANLDSASCNGLYTINDALKACPSGWHLPTVQEFDSLSSFVGGKAMVYKLRTNKELPWFKELEKATDEFGFGAVPTGFFVNHADVLTAISTIYQMRGIPLMYISIAAIFWTSSKDNKSQENMAYMISEIFEKNSVPAGASLLGELFRDAYKAYYPNILMSVRCVKD